MQAESSDADGETYSFEISIKTYIDSHELTPHFPVV